MSVQLFVIDHGSPYIESLLAAFTPESGVEVVGRASDLKSLIDGAITPDVVLIDADHEASDDVLTRVAEVVPQAHIFVVTDREDVEALRETIQSPATAMVAKEARPSDVLAAIRNAGSGGILIHREFVPGGVRSLRHFPHRPASTDSGTSPLTPRESQVLRMLSRGTHVDAIARALNLSVHTVRGHVKNILAKLDSHSQLEAVAKANNLGWLRDEP